MQIAGIPMGPLKGRLSGFSTKTQLKRVTNQIFSPVCTLNICAVWLQHVTRCFPSLLNCTHCMMPSCFSVRTAFTSRARLILGLNRAHQPSPSDLRSGGTESRSMSVSNGKVKSEEEDGLEEKADKVIFFLRSSICFLPCSIATRISSCILRMI